MSGIPAPGRDRFDEWLDNGISSPGLAADNRRLRRRIAELERQIRELAIPDEEG